MKQRLDTIARPAEYGSSQCDVKSINDFKVHFKYIWRDFHAVHHRVSQTQQTNIKNLILACHTLNISR